MEAVYGIFIQRMLIGSSRHPALCQCNNMMVSIVHHVPHSPAEMCTRKHNCLYVLGYTFLEYISASITIYIRTIISKDCHPNGNTYYAFEYSLIILHSCISAVIRLKSPPSQVTKQVDWESVINLVFVYLRPVPRPTNVSRLRIREIFVYLCLQMVLRLRTNIFPSKNANNSYEPQPIYI